MILESRVEFETGLIDENFGAIVSELMALTTELRDAFGLKCENKTAVDEEHFYFSFEKLSVTTIKTSSGSCVLRFKFKSVELQFMHDVLVFVSKWCEKYEPEGLYAVIE